MPGNAFTTSGARTHVRPRHTPIPERRSPGAQHSCGVQSAGPKLYDGSTAERNRMKSASAKGPIAARWSSRGHQSRTRNAGCMSRRLASLVIRAISNSRNARTPTPAHGDSLARMVMGKTCPPMLDCKERVTEIAGGSEVPDGRTPIFLVRSFNSTLRIEFGFRAYATQRPEPNTGSSTKASGSFNQPPAT